MALTCPFCRAPGLDEGHALVSLRLGLPYGCARCGRALRQVHPGAPGRLRARRREALIFVASTLVAFLWIWLARPLRTAGFTWPDVALFGRPLSLYLGRLLFYGGLAALALASVVASATVMVREVRQDSRAEPFAPPGLLTRSLRWAGLGLLVVLAWYLRVFSLLRRPAVLFLLGALALVGVHTVLVTLVAYVLLRRRR